MLKTKPAVFAVKDTYQIMAPVISPSLFWVRVGDKFYYDHSNGIMRSLSEIHRVTIPMSELDAAGCYTVYERPLVERKPYFTETAPVEETTYKFRPVPKSGARCYHISDAHNKIKEPVEAAIKYGEIDFLIFNGDVIDHSGDVSNFINIYEIAAALTGGSIPVVFSRGNHDMRGSFAEKFAEYTPNHNGNTYYTFRLGSIWGIVLDCGEDKPDDSDEYGHTVCCHSFRENETKFIENVIADAANEYAKKGVETRIVISHNPFTHQLSRPFNIEKEIYTTWATLLRENVKPDLMICGHLHELEIYMKDDSFNHLGGVCPVVVGSMPGKDVFYGCGIEFNDSKINISFNGSNGEVVSEKSLPRSK